MSLLLAAALAAIQPACSWDRPGANRYTGSVESAIDGYAGIPEAARRTLKRRVAENQPDDMVDITRDAIHGKYQYDPAIHDMHFGGASVCGTVTRDKWVAGHVEPGAVYCVERHCILVPRICGNISRISRIDRMTPPAPPLAVAVTAAPLAPPAYDLERVARRKELGLLDAEGHDEIEREGMLIDIAPTPVGGPGPDQFGGGRRTPSGGDDADGGPIAPVPEADTWAMLLGGLGLLGLVSARRRRAARR